MDNLPLYSQDFTIFTRSYLQYWIPWPCLSQDGSDPDILQRDHGLEEVTERQRVWLFLGITSFERAIHEFGSVLTQPWLIGGLEHFLFFPYIGINHPAQLTNIFQRGWNHQPDEMTICCLYQCVFMFELRYEITIKCCLMLFISILLWWYITKRYNRLNHHKSPIYWLDSCHSSPRA